MSTSDSSGPGPDDAPGHWEQNQQGPGGTQPFGGQPPYGQPPYGQQPAYGYGPPPKHPQAVTVLVMGLVGLIGGFVCVLPALMSPFAWVMGGRALKEVQASPGRYAGEGELRTGWICGIIGTVLLVLGVLAFVGIFVFVLGFGAMSP